MHLNTHNSAAVDSRFCKLMQKAITAFYSIYKLCLYMYTIRIFMVYYYSVHFSDNTIYCFRWSCVNKEFTVYIVLYVEKCSSVCIPHIPQWDVKTLTN